MPSSKRCSTPEYSCAYRRSRRHIDYYIKEALALTEGNHDSYSESQIIEILFEKTGFRVHPETLSKEMRKFIKKYGEAPVEPVFRPNKEFFEKHPPTPPKHYHRRIDEKTLAPYAGG